MGATGKRRVGMTAAVIIAALAVCASLLRWHGTWATAVMARSATWRKRSLLASLRSGLAWKFRLRARQPAR